MPCKLRGQYPGAIYHVMNRGDRRERIFQDDQDRQSFLQTLGQACQKTGWQVHAYCLMANQFQLVLTTPNANLIAGMARFQDSDWGRRHGSAENWRCGVPGSNPGRSGARKLRD